MSHGRTSLSSLGNMSTKTLDHCWSTWFLMTSLFASVAVARARCRSSCTFPVSSKILNITSIVSLLRHWTSNENFAFFERYSGSDSEIPSNKCQLFKWMKLFFIPTCYLRTAYANSGTTNCGMAICQSAWPPQFKQSHLLAKFLTKFENLWCWKYTGFAKERSKPQISLAFRFYIPVFFGTRSIFRIILNHKN